MSRSRLPRQFLALCGHLPPGLAAQQVWDPPWTLRWRGEAAVQTRESSGQAHHQSRSYGLGEVCPARVYDPKFNNRNKPQKLTGCDSSLKTRSSADWRPIPWLNVFSLLWLLWWISITMHRDHLHPFSTTFTSPRKQISSFSNIWGWKTSAIKDNYNVSVLTRFCIFSNLHHSRGTPKQIMPSYLLSF